MNIWSTPVAFAHLIPEVVCGEVDIWVPYSPCVDIEGTEDDIKIKYNRQNWAKNIYSILTIPLFLYHIILILWNKNTVQKKKILHKKRKVPINIAITIIAITTVSTTTSHRTNAQRAQMRRECTRIKEYTSTRTKSIPYPVHYLHGMDYCETVEIRGLIWRYLIHQGGLPHRMNVTISESKYNGTIRFWLNHTPVHRWIPIQQLIPVYTYQQNNIPVCIYHLLDVTSPFDVRCVGVQRCTDEYAANLKPYRRRQFAAPKKKSMLLSIRLRLFE